MWTRARLVGVAAPESSCLDPGCEKITDKDALIEAWLLQREAKDSFRPGLA